MILLSTVPACVLHRLSTDYPVPELGAQDVCVDMIMCPVNPSDINQIQGFMLLTCIHTKCVLAGLIL